MIGALGKYLAKIVEDIARPPLASDDELARQYITRLEAELAKTKEVAAMLREMAKDEDFIHDRNAIRERRLPSNMITRREDWQNVQRESELAERYNRERDEAEAAALAPREEHRGALHPVEQKLIEKE